MLYQWNGVEPAPPGDLDLHTVAACPLMDIHVNG